MVSLKEYIFEAKFSNFTELELAAFRDELTELQKNESFLKQIAASRRKGASFALDSWAKTHLVPESDKVEYGKTYLLIFDNPFATGKQLTHKEDQEYLAYPEPCEKEADKVVMCLAVADKFGKLHLVNQWEPGCSVSWKDKGLYMKTTVTDHDAHWWDKDGEHRGDMESQATFYSGKGWYLLRKNYPCYYVNQDTHKSGVNDFWYIYPEKQENAYVRLEDCVILDVTTLPAQFDKIQKDIEKRAKEHEEYKKREEARLKAEEEAAKWWAERDKYTDFGCMNGWSETPAELKKAFADKEADWYYTTIGRCYKRYFSDKYKVTYTVDSSD